MIERASRYLSFLLLVSCVGELGQPPQNGGDTFAGDASSFAGDAATAGDRATAGDSATAGDTYIPDPCGNSIIDAGEDCEDGNLDGATCESLDYDGGTLACSSCSFDTSGCTSTGIIVAIDSTTTRQVIDGFGFFGPMRTWWGSSDPSAYYTTEWLDMVLNDLGLTIWRNEYYSEESNQDANWAKQRPMVEALKARIDANGIDGFKFIYSVWSPPSAWKTNNSLKNGGHLEAAHYADFGQWLVDGIDLYTELGIDLYAVSPQNEPLFSQFYNSCVYTIDEYLAMIEVVGPIIHAAYPDVNIFGPEHMLFGVARDWDWDHFDPSQATLSDAEGHTHLDLWACHGYGSDGATPTASSEEALYWQTAHQRIGPFGKRKWMTETSGYGGAWSSTLDYVMSIHAALRFGEISGWVHFYGADDFVTPTALTKAGHAASQYFKYVRPGATALTVDTADVELLVTAFEHTQHDTFTVVLINSGTQSKEVTLTGAPATMRLVRTSESENSVDGGVVSAAAVSLPPRSISTLVTP